MKEKETRPYLPCVTLRQMLDFRPDAPETWTASRFVNEFLLAFHAKGLRQVEDIEEYLCVPPKTVTNTLRLETGLDFRQFFNRWSFHQIIRLKAANPAMTLEQIAPQAGLASNNSILRIKRSPRYRQILQDLKEAGEDVAAIQAAEKA